MSLTIQPLDLQRDKKSFLSSCKLELKDVDVSIANAIPRCMVRWTPTVSLNNNHSNHFVVHRAPREPRIEEIRNRIEFIPWSIPPELIPEDCFELPDSDQPANTDLAQELKDLDEEKLARHDISKLTHYQLDSAICMPLTPKNSLKFSLKKTFESKTDRPVNCSAFPLEIVPILSSDIQWVPWNERQVKLVDMWYKKRTPRFLSGSQVASHLCAPGFGDIILGQLRPGEEIDVTFYLTKSNSLYASHYGGSPVTARTVLKPVPQITFRNEITDLEDIHKIIAACPTKVFGRSGQNSLIVRNPRNCTHCKKCVEVPSGAKNIVIGDASREFEVFVETRNGIPLRDLIERTFQTLIDRCGSYMQSLKT